MQVVFGHGLHKFHPDIPPRIEAHFATESSTTGCENVSVFVLLYQESKESEYLRIAALQIEEESIKTLHPQTVAFEKEPHFDGLRCYLRLDILVPKLRYFSTRVGGL